MLPSFCMERYHFNQLLELKSLTMKKLQAHVPGFKLLMRKLFRRKYKSNNEEKSQKLRKMSSTHEDQDYHKDTTDFSDDFSESDVSSIDEEEFPKINDHFAEITHVDERLSKKNSKEITMKGVIDESRTESSVSLEKEISVSKDQGIQFIVINDDDDDDDDAQQKTFQLRKGTSAKLDKKYNNPDIIFAIDIEKQDNEKEDTKKTPYITDSNGFLSKDIFDD
jgi:hypothetical protein